MPGKYSITRAPHTKTPMSNGLPRRQPRNTNGRSGLSGFSKYVCWTINNPSEDGNSLVTRLAALNSVKAVVCQLETGENGTPHLQGYIEMANSRPLQRIKRLLGGNAHVERRKGSTDQAVNYCKKDDSRTDGPWEAGDFTPTRTRGQRTDLEAVVQTMRESNSIADVVDAHPVQAIRYSRGLQFVYNHLKAPTVEKTPEVILYYGVSGSGKTRLALSHPRPFKKAGGSKWFDGYDHHETLIMDDFAGGRNAMKLCDLLNILDRYHVKLEIKGGYVDRNCSKLIVTTNLHPSTWYDYSIREHQYIALRRRFHKVVIFCRDHMDRNSRQIPTGAYEHLVEQDPAKDDIFFDHWIGYGETSNLSLDRPVKLPWLHAERGLRRTQRESLLLVPDTQEEDRNERRSDRALTRAESIVIPDTEESDSWSDSEISVD